MKKILGLILSVLMLSALSVSAFAVSPLTSKGASDSASVSGIYKTGEASDTVYNVDITWGSLEFTYTGESKGTWNPDTHTYTDKTAGSWRCDLGANDITVVNHSNAQVNAQLTYTAKPGFSSVSGVFAESSGESNDGVLVLDSAVGTAVSSAPSQSARLILTGSVPSSIADKTAIGSVTVSLK